MKNNPVTDGDLNGFLKDHPHVKVVGDFNSVVRVGVDWARPGSDSTVKREYPKGYNPHEDKEQEEVCRWLDEEIKEIKYFSTQNGARTTWATANKLKKTGMETRYSRPYFSSTNGAIPRNNVVLELKRLKGGVVSDATKGFG